MLALWPGLAKIIEKVHISRYFESPETDLYIAENACCIDYTDTWLSKRVQWVSTSEIPHHSATNYGCKDTLELDTGIAWASLPITRLHLRIAPKPKTHWLLATLHNTWWMDHCQVHHGSFELILILDPVDDEEAHSHIALRHHSLQWHVRSNGCRYVSFG